MGNRHATVRSRPQSTMEDELTCPVCLELYADPLLLPCSHSICKPCLHDILDNRYKSGKDGLDCPSCRKSHAINKSKVGKLPRNLALENIVFRYQELQSQNLAKQRSGKGLDLGLAALTAQTYPGSSNPVSPMSPTSPVSMVTSDLDSLVLYDEISELCSLCDENAQNKAAWYCEQCSVTYCQTCLDNFHPKRGPLAHHKLRKPAKNEKSVEKQAFCSDHETEQAAIFCAKCQQLVCHLCVCEGLGKHSQHKIISLDKAWNQTKDTVSGTKHKLEELVSQLTEENVKMEDITEELELLHSQACEKIELQHRRLLEDVSASLRQHRHATLHALAERKSRQVARLRAQLEENRQQSRGIEGLLETSKKLMDVDHVRELLGRAAEVAPLVERQEAVAERLQGSRGAYQELAADKTTQQEMKQSVVQFKASSHACLKCMLVDDADQCQSIIPVVKSPASPGKDTPRVVNKCLTTWGFNSTTFTAEPLQFNAMWSVTVEKNASQMGDLKNGYVFGVGISFSPLNFKDQVGMNSTSHAIVCSGGNLMYANNSKTEQLMPLDCLPLSVTIYCIIDQSEGVVLAYSFTDATWGDTLQGKRIITDRRPSQDIYPVFTVSQRVKMQFPTYV